MITCQLLRPKFILLALVVIINFGQHAMASPVPDVLEDATKQTSNFINRATNTFNDGPNADDKDKLTTLEMVLIGVGAFLVFMFLLCCIGYCLCECMKELICCICCCGRN